VAWLIHAAILAILHRLLHGRRPYFRQFSTATKNPTRLALLLLALAGRAADRSARARHQDRARPRIGIWRPFACSGWKSLSQSFHIGANLYLLNFRIDVEDNLLARKHVTQVRVLLRALDTVIVLVTLGFALMTFSEVRQLWREPVCLRRRRRGYLRSRRAAGAEYLIAGIQDRGDAADPARRRRHLQNEYG